MGRSSLNILVSVRLKALASYCMAAVITFRVSFVLKIGVVHKETTTSLFSSPAISPNYHSLSDFIFSIDHPPVISSSPPTMVMCFCRKWAIVRTSWTDNNPGRRFWGCPDPNSSCGFIGWYDEPMCARSKVIIPGLLRTINKLRKAMDDIKEQASKQA
ncbi:unnamed protein product [Lactuca saligna]|uniref:GRF-type domain-containing protein n=1 Tax=Lactuca saligna TaxID=75948 RepID=A0AA35ZPP6_LACSI|nr:unnamed protein product [Lactuca saligna]